MKFLKLVLLIISLGFGITSCGPERISEERTRPEPTSQSGFNVLLLDVYDSGGSFQKRGLSFQDNIIPNPCNKDVMIAIEDITGTKLIRSIYQWDILQFQANHPTFQFGQQATIELGLGTYIDSIRLPDITK